MARESLLNASNHHLAAVDFVLDLVFQTAPAGNVLRVELGVEAFLRKIGLQPLRETTSVFAGVRDEHAQWFGRGASADRPS